MNIICPYCLETIDNMLQKCPYCGELLPKEEGNSWVVSLILACYLGFFGLHNFYNNKNTIGIAQLFLTISLFGIIINIFWILIDMSMILFDKYRDSQGRKLSRKITIQSTALLSLIFIHRFYVKRYISATLFLLILGGLGIWWLADFITILTGHFKDENGNLITE